jgi:hypothetical protein
LSAKIPLDGVMPPDIDFPTAMISGFKPWAAKSCSNALR